MNKKEIAFFILLTIAATIIKIKCAPDYALSGITGMMSIALFAGLNKTYDSKLAFLLPILALLASNCAIQVMHVFGGFPFQGFYNWQIVEYSLTIVLTGVGLLFRRGKTVGIFASAVVGPTVFFLISNFITWVTMWKEIGYSHDFSGLINCYTQGLPFYRNSLLSTIVLLPMFIMAYHWIVKGKATLVLAD